MLDISQYTLSLLKNARACSFTALLRVVA